MKLTNREKVLLPASLIIIVVALFINFVYLPLNKEIDALHSQTNDLSYQLLDAENKQRRIAGLKDELTQNKEEFETQYANILQIWDQAELLTFVEDTVGSYSVMKSIDFFDAITADRLQAGEINVVMKTSYDKLAKILHRFENADYYNNITLLNITGPEKNQTETEAESDALEVSMNLRFYSHNQPGPFPEKYDFMDGKYGKDNIFE